MDRAELNEWVDHNYQLLSNYVASMYRTKVVDDEQLFEVMSLTCVRFIQCADKVEPHTAIRVFRRLSRWVYKDWKRKTCLVTPEGTKLKEEPVPWTEIYQEPKTDVGYKRVEAKKDVKFIMSLLTAYQKKVVTAMYLEVWPDYVLFEEFPNKDVRTLQREGRRVIRHIRELLGIKVID